MPLYSFRCSNGHSDRLFSKIAERDAVRWCTTCGASFHRQFEAPAVRPEITPYQSPVDGHWVDSRAARRDDLARNGCIEWEPGIRQDMPRRRQALDDKAFEPIAQGIEEVARDLISAGKLDPL